MFRWIDIPEGVSNCRGPAFLGITRKLPSNYIPPKLKLYGIVNNAGIGPIQTTKSLGSILDVNYYGIKSVCSAFIPFLISNGKGSIVNVTGSAGPFYVSKCSLKTQKFLTDPSTTHEDLEGFIKDCRAFNGESKAFLERGYGNGNSYGFSKACANLLTLQLAKENPNLRINACCPGFVETKLTQVISQESGINATDMGMKSPVHATKVIIKCLFHIGFENATP